MDMDHAPGQSTMMDQNARRTFVEHHRTCIFGFQRKHGPPSMSVVYYVMDGDDLLVRRQSLPDHWGL
jgi:hypothetical protein